ncbi:hypothetical protein NCCP28_14620 [Niallia sp. NCCP-28]|nr:hypothetical protein NCCP28_14620 [Niallia sp. NCCP-28]
MTKKHYMQKLFSKFFGEMPVNSEFLLPDDAKNLVLHAILNVGETKFSFPVSSLIRLIRMEVK